VRFRNSVLAEAMAIASVGLNAIALVPD
jgi:hypothetical protein